MTKHLTEFSIDDNLIGSNLWSSNKINYEVQNVFDQDLNTTNDVTFKSVISSNALHVYGMMPVKASQYQMLESIPVGNSNVFVDIMNGTSFIGSRIIPAGFMKAGSSWAVRISGVIKTNGTENMITEIRCNDTIVCSGNTIVGNLSDAYRFFEIEVDGLCRRIDGTNAIVLGDGQLVYVYKDAVKNSYEGSSLFSGSSSTGGSPEVSLDNTINQTISCHVRWENLDNDNDLRIDYCSIVSS